MFFSRFYTTTPTIFYQNLYINKWSITLVDDAYTFAIVATAVAIEISAGCRRRGSGRRRRRDRGLVHRVTDQLVAQVVAVHVLQAAVADHGPTALGYWSDRGQVATITVDACRPGVR